MKLIVILICLAVAIVAVQAGRWGWQEWQLSTQPGFHEVDCWFSKLVTGETTCGYLVVRENRQMPNSRLIRLPVVIFAAEPNRKRHQPGAPILYLTGGPGGEAYIGEQRDVDSWWLERRIFPNGHDLIVMGQRGTGLKEPDFDCTEFDTPEINLEALHLGNPPSDRRSRTITAAIACAERLQGEGVDLTAYNSRESAADIAELRKALGIEAWNLYGVSYGTRLALSVLRYHPEGVRTAVLDSVLPPEANHLADNAAFFRAALHRFLTGCIGRAPCKPPPDGPWAQYLRARELLRQRPFDIDLSAIDPDTNLVLTVDDLRFDRLLFSALYRRETRRFILPAIRGIVGDSIGPRAQATRGSGEVQMRDLLTGVAQSGTRGSDAVYLSHVCHDEVPFEPAERIAAAAAAAGPHGRLITDDSDTYLCPVWPSGAAETVENTPVESDVPALLLAGNLDPVTPPTLARSAAEHLANSHVVVFLKAGHGVIYEVGCAGSLIAEFLVDPQRRPRGDCLRSDFLFPQ